MTCRVGQRQRILALAILQERIGPRFRQNPADFGLAPTGCVHQQRSTAVILLVDMFTAPEMKPNQVGTPRTGSHYLTGVPQNSFAFAT